MVFSHSRMIWKSATSSRPRQNRLALRIVDLLPARVVAAALHVADLQRLVEMLLQEWNVFVEELFLQVLRAGGDHHALARKNRGNQIGQRLARACSGIDNEMFLGERGFDSFSHLELTGPILVMWMPLGKRPVPAEELAGAA